MEKRGISPLIATVLLIGFTIVLAAVVMRWGGEFVRTTTEQTACETDVATTCIGVRFSIDNVVFDDVNGANITISSNTDQPIDGFRIKLWKPDGTSDVSEEKLTPLSPYASVLYQVQNTTEISRVEALPVLTVENCPSGVCSESGMEYTL